MLRGHRLKDEVFADVPHRQWVFTIPKRLRIYFRFDRALLGKLWDEKMIDQDTVAGMREWKHSRSSAVALLRRVEGFPDWNIGVDNSVIIEAEDKEGMQRLVEYISRCPFSLTRIISTTKEGDILYRASNPQCVAFPIAGDQELTSGNLFGYALFYLFDILFTHYLDYG